MKNASSTKKNGRVTLNDFSYPENRKRAAVFGSLTGDG